VFVILTSKPGQFRTEPGDAAEPVEAWDYLFCGRLRARFVIARLLSGAKIRIVEESAGAAVNMVPTKFLPKFDSLEDAREELNQLAHFGTIDVQLTKVAP
jgi:hypothetical protein